MHKAEVADFHESIGQDMLEESADKFNHIEVGGSLSSACRFTVGKGDEEMRSGKLFFKLFVQPLLGFVMLAMWAVPVAARMINAVLPATALALISTWTKVLLHFVRMYQMVGYLEAVSVVPANDTMASYSVPLSVPSALTGEGELRR